MTKTLKIGRRSFLAGQACAIGAASAGVANAGTNDGNMTWQRAAKPQFSKLVGETFEAKTETGETIQMKLREAVAGKSGWHRPIWLKRSEGVSLAFDSPQIEALVEQGSQVVTVTHAALGTADVYIDVMPRRRGGHELEVILN